MSREVTMTTKPKGVYRDAVQALSERIAELDRQIAKLEASFSTLFWRSAAQDIDLSVPQPLETVHERSDHDTLMAALEQRERRLSQLQAALNDIETLEARWERPKFGFLDAIPTSRSIKTSPKTQAKLREFEEMMRHAVPGATVEPRGNAARRVRFVDGENTPFEVLCVNRASRFGGMTSTHLIVRTTVPLLLNTCQISSRSILRDLLVSLRLLHPIAIDDPSFDDFFIVRGDRETALAILTPWVRMHLVDLAWNAAPNLIVGHGEARLTRSWTADAQSIRTTLAVLRGVRATPEGFGLRTARHTEA